MHPGASTTPDCAAAGELWTLRVIRCRMEHGTWSGGSHASARRGSGRRHPVTQPEHWTTGLARLETDVRGQVLTAGSEDYDKSRHVFNAMIDRYPAVIVRCVEV